MADDSLERELEQRVEALGFEFVDLEQLGAKNRPILRLRIDRPGSEPGRGVTLEDCTAVSRALEPFLDEHQDVAERYVLEVSSPGVERPLVKASDYRRFTGKQIRIKTHHPIGTHGKRVEGTLVGLDEDPKHVVKLQQKNGETLEIPMTEISKANLVYRWEDR